MKEKIVMTEENGGRGVGQLDVPTANCNSEKAERKRGRSINAVSQNILSEIASIGRIVSQLSTM